MTAADRSTTVTTAHHGASTTQRARGEADKTGMGADAGLPLDRAITIAS